MRTFSEERRTGTYEVLLTAPVQEWVVVLSKFLACWLFFLVAWLPMFMYLLTLPLVGTSFDYRPILTFYLALACTGAGFIAMGTFFSSTTKNQIIAAVLTGAMMFFYLLTIVASSVPYVGDGIKSAVAGLSFLSLWQSAAQGELTVQTILVHLSLTVFWLFLTVKVLETRKWS
jgi:ABC-2 type transport system permease protein